MAVSRRDFLKLSADGTGTAIAGVIGAEMSLGRPWRKLTTCALKTPRLRRGSASLLFCGMRGVGAYHWWENR
jgi:hypothetical protein